MLLPSRLESTTLGDLLGILYRGNATGVLELAETAVPGGPAPLARTHRIQLLSGLVASVETDLDATPIGEILARANKVDRRALDVMLYRMALGDPRPAGAILVGMGAITADTLIWGLREQIQKKLDAIYRGLKDARISFRTSRPLPKDVLRIGPLMPRDFLFGRPRKRDGKNRKPPVTSKGSASRAPWWATHEWGLPADAPPPSGRRTVARAPVGPRAQALRTLGLPDDADETSIRRAFKRLATELHPDRHSMSPEDVRARHAARFAEASAAFHLLVA